MIIVFGTVCLDRLRKVNKMPAPGGYAEVEEEHLMLGGEAANTAIALRKWGAEVKLVGNNPGLQDQGETITNLLADRGLWLETPTNGYPEGTPTPICDIYITPDGDRTMFGSGFAHLGQSESLTALPLIPGTWFTAEPNLGPTAREAARRAQEAEMRTYLMDFFQPDDPISPGTFWQSSTDWVGTRGNTQKNVAWVKKHVAQFGTFTILSDGPNGFVAGSPEHSIRAYPPYPAPTVEDTTGAGDAFRAGMLFGLSSNWEMAECLRFASATGSLSCATLGGSDAAPSLTLVRDFLQQHEDVGRQYA